VPLLAYLIWSDDRGWMTPALLGGLSVVALVYAWRFGLHPRLRADATGVTVVNPFSVHRFAWDDLRVIAPGENGLVLATPDGRAEAWCVQKSNRAAKRGEATRADRIAHELLDILEVVDPPLEDEQTGLRIRRARFDESRLLTSLERGANELTLAHLFPPNEYPYPMAEVQKRWRRRLRDGRTRIYLLLRQEQPVGYVAFGEGTIHHLGVLADQHRRGYGSALLEFASLEVFADGAPEAVLWVLSGNEVARAFYRAHGWTETEERKKAEFPPYPEELKLVRRNPSAPRRSR
jgi:ribosomal protein S18 acetylase RimI-like enzyme